MIFARPGLWWLTWQGGKVLCSEVAASPAAGSCQVVARAAESRPLALRFCSITQRCVNAQRPGALKTRIESPLIRINGPIWQLISQQRIPGSGYDPCLCPLRRTPSIDPRCLCFLSRTFPQVLIQAPVGIMTSLYTPEISLSRKMSECKARPTYHQDTVMRVPWAYLASRLVVKQCSLPYLQVWGLLRHLGLLWTLSRHLLSAQTPHSHEGRSTNDGDPADTTLALNDCHLNVWASVNIPGMQRVKATRAL